MLTLTRTATEPDTRCTCGDQLVSHATGTGPGSSTAYRHADDRTTTCTTPTPVPCDHAWCTGDATAETLENCPDRLSACCSCCQPE